MQMFSAGTSVAVTGWTKFPARFAHTVSSARTWKARDELSISAITPETGLADPGTSWVPVIMVPVPSLAMVAGPATADAPPEARLLMFVALATRGRSVTGNLALPLP